MPLDRGIGEVLEGLPASMHVVVEPRHLASMSNLMVPYLEKRKFRSVEKVRPLFDDAVAYAIDAFANAGALRPIKFDETSVLCQVYPKDFKVAIVFQRDVAGETRYVSRIYDLPPVVIDSLLATTGKKHREH